MDAVLERAVLEALATGSLSEVTWNGLDDGCDCSFQRVGFFTNPYLAETLEVRFCCFWAEWHKEHPEWVRTTPAFREYNRNEWVTEPADWNGEADMPSALWYRQLARQQDRPIAEIRAEYQHRDSERPKGRGQPVPFIILLDSVTEVEIDLASIVWD